MNPAIRFTEAMTQASKLMVKEFFSGEKMPEAFITIQRRRNARGYFAPKRLRNSTETVHEIALNPETFESPKQVTSTLLHELVHLWQQENGKPGKGAYHNKEWAKRMHSVGLKPYNVYDATKEVGLSVSHTIEEGGAFDTFWKSTLSTLVTDESLYLDVWPKSRAAAAKTKRKSTKYTCPSCQEEVRGVRGLHIQCLDCEEDMVPRKG